MNPNQCRGLFFACKKVISAILRNSYATSLHVDGHREEVGKRFEFKVMHRKNRNTITYECEK